MANQGTKIPGLTPSAVSQAQKQTKKPEWIHHGAAAATKWTNTSLTSEEMFFFLRQSIQTVVFLGTKLLGGSHESLDAANLFQQTLYSLPPGVPGSGLSIRIFSAVKSSSSPSSSKSTSPAVNSKVTGRPLGSGARGQSWVWSRSRILLSPHEPHTHPARPSERLPPAHTKTPADAWTGHPCGAAPLIRCL